MKRDPKADVARSVHSGVADIDAYVRRIVEAAPPLTPEQRDRLAVLLRGGGTR